MQVLSAKDQARKEIRDMVDAISSIVVRDYPVDNSFVITEIKNYILDLEFATENAGDLKVIQYTRKQKLGGGALASALNTLRSKVQRISSIRFASCPPEGSN